MQKRNENQGRSTPKFPLPLPNMTDNDTMNIVEFLYPTYPPSRRRYPLTRCLLGCLVENVKVYEPEEKHNFKTIIEILSDLLTDMNDESIDEEDKLRVLSKLFYTDDCADAEYNGIVRVGQDIRMSELSTDMFQLFYGYNKFDSQKYTVAGLLYDLIPLVNVSFADVKTAIKNSKDINDLIEFRQKAAVFNDNKPMLLLYKCNQIAKRLFPQDVPIQRSVFQIAVLKAVEKHGSLDLHVDFSNIKRYLMHVYNGHTELSSDLMECGDGVLINVMSWLYQIATSSNSISNTILNVSERLLMAEGYIDEVFTESLLSTNELRSTIKKEEFFF